METWVDGGAGGVEARMKLRRGWVEAQVGWRRGWSGGADGAEAQVEWRRGWD